MPIRFTFLRASLVPPRFTISIYNPSKTLTVLPKKYHPWNSAPSRSTPAASLNPYHRPSRTYGTLYWVTVARYRALLRRISVADVCSGAAAPDLERLQQFVEC
jgi:hypothetical protein